eukprot:1597992-Rhodomonas_salina.2
MAHHTTCVGNGGCLATIKTAVRPCSSSVPSQAGVQCLDMWCVCVGQEEMARVVAFSKTYASGPLGDLTCKHQRPGLMWTMSDPWLPLVAAQLVYSGLFRCSEAPATLKTSCLNPNN